MMSRKPYIFNKEDQAIIRQVFDSNFGPIIWSYVKQIKSFSEKEGLKDYERYLLQKSKEGLKSTIQKWTDAPHQWASVKAIEYLENKFKVNPFHLNKVRWGKRYNFGDIEGLTATGKPTRVSILHFEHTTPNTEFISSLVSCESELEVMNELKGHSGVCIVLREENIRLDAKYKDHRIPEGMTESDWEKCYSEVGIEIVNRSDYSNDDLPIDK